MKIPWWAVGLRSLAGIRRELTLIRLALDRLAPPQDVVPPPAPDDPVTVAYGNDRDRNIAYLVEQRLRDTLGRDPSPEEILTEVDGLEQAAAEEEIRVRH